MSSLGKQVARLVTDEDGQEILEYALVAGLAVAAAGAVLPGIANLWQKLVAHVVARSGVLAPAAATDAAGGDGVVMIRIICGIVAVILLMVIVLRRRSCERRDEENPGGLGPDRPPRPPGW